ncbi:hypothetical protein AOY87_02160 [Escherichia coli]|nr:hypothetical protein AOY87_02160 [Escherichia coli]
MKLVNCTSTSKGKSGKNTFILMINQPQAVSLIYFSSGKEKSEDLTLSCVCVMLYRHCITVSPAGKISARRTRITRRTDRAESWFQYDPDR